MAQHSRSSIGLQYARYNTLLYDTLPYAAQCACHETTVSYNAPIRHDTLPYIFPPHHIVDRVFSGTSCIVTATGFEPSFASHRCLFVIQSDKLSMYLAPLRASYFFSILSAAGYPLHPTLKFATLKIYFLTRCVFLSDPRTAKTGILLA